MIAALVLATVCLHEFAWQLFPCELQGSARYFFELPMIAVLCFAAARPEKATPFMKAVLVGSVFMSSTTALCTGAWLINPWEVGGCEEQCSKQWGFPMLLLSALAACVPLILGRSRRE